MASIYDIVGYEQNSTYKKDDIVKFGDYYWYARKDVPINSSPSLTNSLNWGGVIKTSKTTHSDAVSTTSPHFIWEASYNMQTSHAPRVKSIVFGDGYEQKFKDGINNNLLQLSLNFESRNTKEATAILHFLESRNGSEAFFFRPPSPYNTLRKFTCAEFSSTVIFKNNINISATFKQVP